MTGPHLHWLADYGKLTIDPLDLVNLDFTAPPPLTSSPGLGAKAQAEPQPDN